MGVFLNGARQDAYGNRLPHARGGVSSRPFPTPSRPESSPRSWGCFRWPSPLAAGGGVFPTLVGVFLRTQLGEHLPGGLPHARGGVSHDLSFFDRCRASSPRSWGCFQDVADMLGVATVFPTLVGVFLRQLEIDASRERLPHARGGVSPGASRTCGSRQSSPRSWGCFFPPCSSARKRRVFPTLVGVFLRIFVLIIAHISLPHARGGVSIPGSGGGREVVSSPRSWGCFYFRAFIRYNPQVFPTLVGVFLYPACR